MTITSARLTLRRWTSDDLGALHPVLGDPEVVWWDRDAGTLAHSREVLDRVLAYTRDLRDPYGWYAVVETATGEVVGNVLARPSTHEDGACELGWHVRKDRWRQGIGFEAAEALRQEVAAVVAPPRFVAVIDVSNTPSKRVAARLGMEPLREIEYDGSPHLLYATP